jgi:ABC-type Fe3+/spermidine/putrescine transport system ATPase subunit
VADLVLDGLGKRYGGAPPRRVVQSGKPRHVAAARNEAAADAWVVQDLSLAIREGEFLTLLGPSGCGKTTTLRMIAGFVEPTAGRIVLGGRVLSSAGERTMVPPERRGMGMVFQSYAVWPHMTAAQNVAYPLRRARLSRADVERRTREALSLVHLDGLGARYPQELSGGQQQRVALARALAMEPLVLLLDEPLSNLDARLRDEMRVELRDLHERLGITVVYVTHDQGEAMALSDRIAVLLGGRMVQAGTPRELYEHPADPQIAAFVGAANFLPGEVVGQDDGAVRVRLLDGAGTIVLTVPGGCAPGRVLVCVRPEALAPAPDGPLVGRVARATYLGSRVDYLVRVGALVVRAEGQADHVVRAGEDVRLAVRRAVLYPDSASAVTPASDRTT